MRKFHRRQRSGAEGGRVNFNGLLKEEIPDVELHLDTEVAREIDDQRQHHVIREGEICE
jgi:hypothetical protein